MCSNATTKTRRPDDTKGTKDAKNNTTERQRTRRQCRFGGTACCAGRRRRFAAPAETILRATLCGLCELCVPGFLSVSESLWWFVFVTFVASWLLFRFGTHTVTAGLWFCNSQFSRPAQLGGAGLDGDRKRPQAGRVATARRAGIALELLRQRIQLIQDSGGAPLPFPVRIAPARSSAGFTARARSG